eukprot:TRINITY_DN17682_c0_g1_i1.p1 TRINITY_DN17682_c0_g1~~TRINITY_DN17682_c0_g1_i1.p1  ORF type:complete len:109 (+),score=21.88 TRINITY_DN17682_c0_g1_i1:300-626(+)
MTDFPNNLRSTISDSDWSQFTKFLEDNQITSLGDFAAIINLKDEDAQSTTFNSLFGGHLSIVGCGKLWNATRIQRYQEKTGSFWKKIYSFLHDTPYSVAQQNFDKKHL